MIYDQTINNEFHLKEYYHLLLMVLRKIQIWLKTRQAH